MSDPTSPPTIGDVYSGVIPPVTGTPGPLVTRTLFVDPGPSTLVTQYNPPVEQPATTPSMLLAGDNPNKTSPPLAGTDPANMMEMPPVRPDYLPDLPVQLRPQESLTRVIQPNEDTPPEGGKYGDSNP